MIEGQSKQYIMFFELQKCCKLRQEADFLSRVDNLLNATDCSTKLRNS